MFWYQILWEINYENWSIFLYNFNMHHNVKKWNNEINTWKWQEWVLFNGKKTLIKIVELLSKWFGYNIFSRSYIVLYDKLK